MVDIRQAAEENLPRNRLLDLFGHTSGLLCRKHAQHSMRLTPEDQSDGMDERIGDFADMQNC